MGAPPSRFETQASPAPQREGFAGASRLPKCAPERAANRFRNHLVTAEYAVTEVEFCSKEKSDKILGDPIDKKSLKILNL